MVENKKPVLVIMAAGMGSRYGGLKQMDPMDEFGHLIIDYSIYDAVQAGFEEVIFVIKEENKELFKETIGDRISGRIRVSYAFQRLVDLPEGFTVPEGRVKPWGTGHAILSCYFAVNGRPFAVINADDYYGRDAFCKMYEYLSQHEDTPDAYSFAMVGYQLKNTVTENGSISRGVCSVNEKNQLVSIVERTRIEKLADGIAYTEDDGASWNPLSDDTVVSMNMWGFTYSIMDELVHRFNSFLEKAMIENPLKGEFFLPFVVEELLQEKKAVVEVMTTPDKWYGVTYKEDKETVVAALKTMRESGKYPNQLLDA
ncbi:MAG: sugar phosphate nucleotidyltransferase [Eubacteriales bacterium]|nr:sugar phosphate nucleotidyltransferase [Eubacteriales bacterium]